MSRLTTFISETFGGVLISSSSKLNATGSNNRGYISSTSNLSIFATNCVLSISSTNNAKVKATNTDFTCKSGSNLNFEGNGSTVVLESNSRSNMTADDCNITAKSNSNMELKAAKSTLILESNSCANINATETKVNAKSNSNLKLVGKSDGLVDVKNTRNHLVEQNVATKTPENKIEFSDGSYARTFFNGVFGSWSPFSNDNTPSLLTALTFHKLVKIDRYEYNVDNINFTLEPLSGGMYNVRISNVDFTGNLENASQYIVSVNIDGQVQRLRFVAPNISSSSTDNSVFCMSIA